MSNGKLPKYVDPRKLADRDIELTGTVSVADMTRFSSMLVSSDIEVFAELKFSTDELKIRTIIGSAKATVPLQCQRCLEPVDIDVVADFNLAVAFNEDRAKQLPRYYDPLIVEDDELELLPLIEEEMILSLPIVSYHSDCSIQTSFGDGNPVEDSEAEKPNPFSVLASLKGKTDKK